MAMSIETPRSASEAKKSTNWEKWGWIYMRVSGVLLIVLGAVSLWLGLLPR